MDLQQPPKTETGIIVSVTDQEMEKFDSELAALCNGIKAKKSVPSASQISNNFQQSAKEIKELMAVMKTQIPSVESSLDTFTQRMYALEKLTTRLDDQQENLVTKKEVNALNKEIKQIHDNQIELNKRYLELNTSVEASDQAYPRDIKFLRSRIDLLENKQAISLSQFKCLTAGIVGFLAGFLIWFYAHKAELLR
jgi:chromosome segregation ATPase